MGALQGALGARLDVFQQRGVAALFEGEELEAQLLAVARHPAAHGDDLVLHLQRAVLELGAHREVFDGRGARGEKARALDRDLPHAAAHERQPPRVREGESQLVGLPGTRRAKFRLSCTER